MCLQTNWRNMQLQALYPAIAQQSNLPIGSGPPSFANPLTPLDPYSSYMCVVRPHFITDNIVISLSYPFTFSLDSSQSNTFFDVPEVLADMSGEMLYFSNNDNTTIDSMFFVYAPPTSNGILFITHYYSYYDYY